MDHYFCFKITLIGNPSPFSDQLGRNNPQYTATHSNILKSPAV